MSDPAQLAALVPRALRTLLSETLFRASEHGGYLLNRGDPGFVETLRALSAATVSTPPGPGRKPIVSHANHVLYGLELLNRAIGGDDRAFANADWDAAWNLTRVNDAEWGDMLGRLEEVSRAVLEAAPRNEQWDELRLTGVFASAAHTAYHLGAIRQILLDLEQAGDR